MAVAVRAPGRGLALLVAVAVASILVLDRPVPARSQEPEPTTTTIDLVTSTTVDPDTSSSTTPSVTTTGTATTSTTRASTTTTAVDPDLPDHEHDREFQLADIVGEDYRHQPPFDPVGTQVVASAVAQARAEMAAAEIRYRQAASELETVVADLAAIEAELRRLDGADRRALAETAAAQQRLEDAAVDAYIRGNEAELTTLLGSTDPTELASRWVMVESVLQGQAIAIEGYVDRRDALDSEVERLLDDLSTAGHELRRARAAEREAREATADARVATAVWEAGSQVVVDDFVFPVFGPNTFADAYGAPRMSGTRYEHWHEGTDIMAAVGTPLVAVEPGTVTQLDSHVLGGIGFTMRGVSGLEYYYAHLAGFADGITPGRRVEAGDVIGFVGTTGNAVGAHLHFEVHDGGRAVNPYPLLRVAWDWQGPFILDAAARGETG